VTKIHPWPEPWAQVRQQPGARWEWTTPGFPVIQPVRRRAARKKEAPQLELGFEVERSPDSAERRAAASGLGVCFATTTGTRHEIDDSNFWTLRPLLGLSRTVTRKATCPPLFV
jgi:hypothetical protein